MGAWVYVRGWLEFNGQEDEAKRIIARDAQGRAFPEGGRLDAVCLIAALPANEDGDRVNGLFLAFDEEKGQSEWQVREGEVFIAPAAERYDYLWR